MSSEDSPEPLDQLLEAADPLLGALWGHLSPRLAAATDSAGTDPPVPTLATEACTTTPGKLVLVM